MPPLKWGTAQLALALPPPQLRWRPPGQAAAAGGWQRHRCRCGRAPGRHAVAAAEGRRRGRRVRAPHRAPPSLLRACLQMRSRMRRSGRREEQAGRRLTRDQGAAALLTALAHQRCTGYAAGMSGQLAGPSNSRRSASAAPEHPLAPCQRLRSTKQDPATAQLQREGHRRPMKFDATAAAAACCRRRRSTAFAAGYRRTVRAEQLAHQDAALTVVASSVCAE